jgi:hypothetical protein
MALLHDRPSEDGFTLAVLLAWGQFLSHFILETALLLTLLFTFGGDFLTAFLGSRAKDRCLKHFHSYRVNIEENDNRTCEHAEVAVLLRVLDDSLLSFDFSLILGHFDPPVHLVSSR